MPQPPGWGIVDPIETNTIKRIAARLHTCVRFASEL